MAQRRMFSLRIIDTDKFLDMPATARELYFELGMRADDDGFISNAKTIRRMVGASEEDLRMLIKKEYLIAWEDGVVVITDWRAQNQIRKDRYKDTLYVDKLKELVVNENGRYIKAPEVGCQSGNQMATNRQPNGNHLAPQYRLGKSRVVKSSLDTTTNNIYIDIDLKGLTPTDGQLASFAQLTDGLPNDLVQLAIDKTVSYADKPSLNYAASIVRYWLRDGITTLEQAQAADRRHDGTVLDEIDPATGEHVKIPMFKLADQEGSGNNGLS